MSLNLHDKSGTYVDENGVVFLATDEAAKRASCTTDHIARICRSGELSCLRVGRSWYIQERSLGEYLEELARRKAQQRSRIAQEREKEYYASQLNLQVKTVTTWTPRVIGMAVATVFVFMLGFALPQALRSESFDALVAR